MVKYVPLQKNTIVLQTIKAILQCKCPQCKEGKLFIHPNPYNLSKIEKMVDYCPKCNLDVRNETGFYWFSMYIAYAISIALSVTTLVALVVLFGFQNFPYYIIIAVIVLLVFMPFTFRWSRIISILLTLKTDKN